MYQLYIGNKNYSSWSLRPWLLMTHFGIAFEEKLVPLTGAGTHTAYSSNGLVPCLHDDDFQVWDTLAIAEFLHDAHPELNIWPTDKKARARARSISAEMHSGFAAMRNAMTMNIKFRLKGTTPSADVAANITRIQAIWTDARRDFAGDKPYLFGDFSAADAMFAPVVWRFETYNVPLDAVAQDYVNTMLAHPAMQAWKVGALADESLAHYDVVLEQYGGVR